MVCLNRLYPLKFFKGCLPQILLDPLFNMLFHLFLRTLKDGGFSLGQTVIDFQAQSITKLCLCVYACVCLPVYLSIYVPVCMHVYYFQGDMYLQAFNNKFHSLSVCNLPEKFMNISEILVFFRFVLIFFMTEVSNRNQSIVLHCKSVDQFLYGRDLHHERINIFRNCFSC